MECIIRKRLIPAKPEEIVRQLYINRLINEYGYNENRIKIEHNINFGREVKRADIVVLEKEQNECYIIIETKSQKL